MVQEVRDVILSLDEVLLAYIGYQRITPEFLPEATLISCKTADNNAVTLKTRTSALGVEHDSDVSFKGIEVLKPLIRFCIENNIMLPRDGKKSILIEKDKIVLHIELNLQVDLPASLNPLRVSHIMAASKNEKAVTPAG